MKNLNIARYSGFDCVAENKQPTIRAILKYIDQPSILVIQSQCEGKHFFLLRLIRKTCKKERVKLNENKASQVSDIPVNSFLHNVVKWPNMI